MITLHGTKQKEETLGLIARAWQDARIGEEITIIQPNDMGGKSLQNNLLKLFPDAVCESKNKSRYISIVKSDHSPPEILAWLDNLMLRFVDTIGYYSAPGLFGWDKIDVGSSLLVELVDDLVGIGSDFGCGYGYLSKSVLKEFRNIEVLYCFDVDLRSVEACRQNVADPRAVIGQTDCTRPIAGLPPLDFIIMNPPFHEGASEDRQLGIRFIETAAHHLKRGGCLWMVANAHLPYEKSLNTLFGKVDKLVEKKGFKIIRALKS